MQEYDFTYFFIGLTVLDLNRKFIDMYRQFTGYTACYCTFALQQK